MHIADALPRAFIEDTAEECEIMQYPSRAGNSEHGGQSPGVTGDNSGDAAQRIAGFRNVTTQKHNHGRLAERENDPTRKCQTLLPDTR